MNKNQRIKQIYRMPNLNINQVLIHLLVSSKPIIKVPQALSRKSKLLKSNQSQFLKSSQFA